MYKELKSRCSSVVEHFLGKEEVVSSILINGSKNFERCMEHSNEIKRVVSSIPITIGINGSKKFERCMEHPNEIKRVVSSIPITIGITVQIVRIIEIEKKQTHINQL